MVSGEWRFRSSLLHPTPTHQNLPHTYPPHPPPAPRSQTHPFATQDDDTGFMFTINTKARVLTMRADNEEEADAWAGVSSRW